MKNDAPPRSFLVPCHFGTEPGRFRVHVQSPARAFGPIDFQMAWLRETRGGVIPEAALRELEKRLKVDLPDKDTSPPGKETSSTD